MLTEFEIKNFKKFTDLKLSDLSRINLFFGVNNVGKTTILEAVFAYACGNNAVTLNEEKIEVQHEFSPTSIFYGLLPNQTGVFEDASFSGRKDISLVQIFQKF